MSSRPFFHTCHTCLSYGAGSCRSSIMSSIVYVTATYTKISTYGVDIAVTWRWLCRLKHGSDGQTIMTFMKKPYRWCLISAIESFVIVAQTEKFISFTLIFTRIESSCSLVVKLITLTNNIGIIYMGLINWSDEKYSPSQKSPRSEPKPVA